MEEKDEALYSHFMLYGNNADLRILMERYRESLTLFLYGYTQNMEDAEEVMLDAFAQAVSGTSHFKGNSSFKTWLFAIGRNLALKRLRKPRLSVVPLSDETYHPLTENPDSAVLSAEKDEMLYLAIEKLPSDYRQVLYLLYFEELTPEEISKVMKKSRTQIYKLASRGRAALRKKLEESGWESGEI